MEFTQEPTPPQNDSFVVPSYDVLKRSYDNKWQEEREKFYNQLKENFQALTSQFRTGRQVIYELTQGPYTEHYIKAFRELFCDTGYQASVGETERLGSGTKKTKKLYVRLPECYNNA